ncbi:MAG: hypothetical protein QM741_06145 [Rudaea sp.]|uniref:tetratricopeptide repeat protein n=1 Tax=Rudaea sp. TaxID=2136325 RepID=UPI0039E2720E
MPRKYIFLFLILILHGTVNASENIIINSIDYLSSHPDSRYRISGLKRYKARNFAEAFEDFHKAARYADKLSQASIAMMLWDGIGVRQNRTEAYAWMDLAAERGYRQFVVLQKYYWQNLNEKERNTALQVSKEVFENYGDTVAKPRLESELKKVMPATGTRLKGAAAGAGNSVRIHLKGPTTDITEYSVDSAEYYSPHYWDPKEYWSWVDTQYQKDLRPDVTIGPPVQMDQKK